MYKPELTKKRTGVPVVSKNDIDSIGERLVADFCAEAFKQPAEIDIDRFAQNYLGLKQDFQYLSHNGIYLGMMVFHDTNMIPVYDPAANRAEYISAGAHTVIIDKGLLDESQEHRYRFTMGHEAAHDILHSDYYRYNLNRMILSDTGYTPMVQCRVDSSKITNRRISLWTDSDWMEWQANRLSSAILMPACMIRQLTDGDPEGPSVFRAACWLNKVCRTFNVSVQAAEIRLRELGLLSGIPKAAVLSELPVFKI